MICFTHVKQIQPVKYMMRTINHKVEIRISRMFYGNLYNEDLQHIFYEKFVELDNLIYMEVHEHNE